MFKIEDNIQPPKYNTKAILADCHQTMAKLHAGQSFFVIGVSYNQGRRIIRAFKGAGEQFICRDETNSDSVKGQRFWRIG